QTHVALDLAHRPAAQHARKLLAHGAAPGRRGGLASGLASALVWGGLARGSLARGGIGAPALAAGWILPALAPLPLGPPPLPLAPAPLGGRGRFACGGRRHVAVEARLLLVVERAVERRERGLDRVECCKRGADPLLHRLEPRRRRHRRRAHVLRAVGGEALR